MEKTRKNKSKDKQRHAGMKFVREYQTWDLRKTASGVVFGGKYVKDRRKPKRKRESSGQT